VYAEPATIDATAAEFGATESMVTAAEQLAGPYVWGRYDLLLMPPAFNYGGMGEMGMTAWKVAAVREELPCPCGILSATTQRTPT